MIIDKAVVRYEPQAKSIPRKPWWAIGVCDSELGRYYRHWFNLFHLGRFKLQRPAWDCHISIVCGEEPRNDVTWGFWEGLEIDIQYDPALIFDGEHAWLRVESKQAEIIRTDLGLDAQPRYPFHITIGRVE